MVNFSLKLLYRGLVEAGDRETLASVPELESRWMATEARTNRRGFEIEQKASVIILTVIRRWWLVLLTAVWFFGGLFSLARAQEQGKIYFFYGIGCPHCARVEEFFEQEGLREQYPIEAREIYFDWENSQLFNSLMTELGLPPDARGVPAVVLGRKVLVGDTPIIENFREEADSFVAQQAGPKKEIGELDEPGDGWDLTLLLVVGAAVVDAINPCAFAVLILLMTTILAGGKASTALKAGLAFSASIFISYFLMGLGLYRALGVSGLAGKLVKAVGVLAIGLGILNLKDWLWYGKGFLMEVPQSWRPRLRQLVGSVTSPPGAFLIGFLVSLFLLPCTSGPYIVILGMLAEKAFQFRALSYLLVYNLVFVAPMVLISWLVYRGLSPVRVERLRQRQLRRLHLIAGLVLIGMGMVILKGWI